MVGISGIYRGLSDGRGRLTIRILTLDQATHQTGFCVLDKDTNEFVAFGTVKANKKKETSLRIHDISRWVKKAITEYKPDMIIIEDIQFQSNNKVYKTLAQLQGVLIDTCIEENVPYKIVPSVTWKRRTGIHQTNRKEDKKMSIAMASKAVGEQVHEDTADAICMALSELQSFGEE